MRELSDSNTISRYAVAVAAIIAATVLRMLMDPVLGSSFPFAALFFAVLLAAWWGGFGPAVFATVMGGIASAFFLLPPTSNLSIADTNDVAGLTLFFFVSLGISFIGGLMRSSQRAAQIHARDASVQREQLAVTLHSIGDAVIVTDVHGRVTLMNAVAEHLTGWRLTSALARPLSEIFTIVNESTRERVENPVDKVLADGLIVGLANHTVLVDASGVERPIDDSAAPIRDRTGHLIGAVLVFRDVTVARNVTERLQRSEQELSDFFENANVGLRITSPDGIVLRANQAELSLLGYERNDFIGRNITEFHADAPVVEELLARQKAGERLSNFPVRLRAKDGSIKQVLINSSGLFEDGKLIHTRCFTLDVTDRNRAAAAQALLASVVESSEDAIVTKTLDGIITSWNIGAERVFGYSAEEAIGQPITLIVPPERSDEEPNILGRLRRGERVQHFDTVRIAKDGRRLDISVSISPVRDASGAIVGAAKVARDMTAHRRAERAAHVAEQRLQLITDNVPALISYIDNNFQYRLNNRAYEVWFGVPRDSIVGKHMRDVLGTAAWERLRPYAEKAVAGQSISFEDEVPYKHGGNRWISGIYVPNFSEAGDVEGFAVLINDITAQRQAEEALRAADRRKDEFLATLAHELRNPLAPIRTSLEILKRPEISSSEAAESRRTMDRQLSHLQRLVDDLLDISRITRDRLELRRERVDLATVVNQAVETCQPLANAAEHELIVELPSETIQLSADPVRLAQVFSNLLNNSCKYTERGGRIVLSARREGDQVIVAVSDTGIGISPDMLPRVFDMFTQVQHDSPLSQGGLGIGLALVRRLVEMHGGAINAHSAGAGRGSTFEVRLPILADALPTVSPTPTPGKLNMTKRRILVVDDNRDAAKMLAMLLNLSGHATHLEHDGEAAVTAAEAFRPEIVLLDLGLPKLTGHEVARAIRQQPWGQDMTLIALTGWGQDEDRRRSSEAGFDFHLVKPVDHAQLTQLIAETP